MAEQPEIRIPIKAVLQRRVEDMANVVASGGTIDMGFVLAGGERPLRDALPRITASRGSICFHADALGRPGKGGAVTCLRCRHTYVALKRRPPREPAHHCYECGHTTPKGPKRKKRWTWVDLATLPDPLPWPSVAVTSTFTDDDNGPVTVTGWGVL